MPEYVDVTFPVRIRLDLEVARGRASMEALREDIAAVVEEAAVDDVRRAKPLADLTPDDDGLGSFALTVDEPTVNLPDFAYALDRHSAAKPIDLVRDAHS